MISLNVTPTVKITEYDRKLDNSVQTSVVAVNFRYGEYQLSFEHDFGAFDSRHIQISGSQGSIS